jgi:hypothetical protein
MTCDKHVEPTPKASGRRDEQCVLCAMIRRLQKSLVGDLEKDRLTLERIMELTARLPYPQQTCEHPHA